ncbi:maleylpyruvate isomerase family mycothiol-dependent enzyme [Cryptosporangium minutisporangium]|uniref:Maleylpyruvate isomerase family mycothiol-dependent enzyme n=1 Tax=Cryptosporangium minutisporangium TaxID=113569 RepID=A0ABP6T890_9ACTN
MDHGEYCKALFREIDRLAALLSDADLTTAVPSCPAWDLAKLAAHVGSTERWVTAMISSGSTERLPLSDYEQDIPTEATALSDWVAAGVDALISALVAAPAHQQVWTLGGATRPTLFWARRMLHEATVHRVDAALALGAPATIDPAVATDGVEELLTILPYAPRLAGFGAVRGDGRSIELVATDVDVRWCIDIGSSGFEWSRVTAASDADVTATAPIAGLYLFLWGRPSVPQITGDSGLLARWSAATAF